MKNEMKKVLLFAAVLLAGNSALAQTPQEDFKRDITLSASNYVVLRSNLLLLLRDTNHSI